MPFIPVREGGRTVAMMVILVITVVTTIQRKSRILSTGKTSCSKIVITVQNTNLGKEKAQCKTIHSSTELTVRLFVYKVQTGQQQLW